MKSNAAFPRQLQADLASVAAKIRITGSARSDTTRPTEGGREATGSMPVGWSAKAGRTGEILRLIHVPYQMPLTIMSGMESVTPNRMVRPMSAPSICAATAGAG